MIFALLFACATTHPMYGHAVPEVLANPHLPGDFGLDGAILALRDGKTIARRSWTEGSWVDTTMVLHHVGEEPLFWYPTYMDLYAADFYVVK